MNSLVDEVEPSTFSLGSRWLPFARVTVKVIPPIVSIGCAAVATYFGYVVVNTQPPEDLSRLAVSILKSDEAPPEMRAWAINALGIASHVPIVADNSVAREAPPVPQHPPRRILALDW